MWKLSWTSLVGFVLSVAVLRAAWGMFLFWADLVTAPGAIALGCVCLGLLVRLAIQVVTFPKSFYYFRRDTEIDILGVVSSRWLSFLTVFSDILSDDEDKDSLHSEEIRVLREIKGRIESLLNVYSFLSKRKQTTRSSDQMHKLFADFKTACCETKVNASSTSFWDALDMYTSLKDANFQAILQCLDPLSAALRENIQGETWGKWLHRWCFNYSLCSLDFMRAELETLHGGEQVWVCAEDNAQIDCMWIPGSSTRAVMLCGGNGFLYECAMYMSDSFQQYLQMGFSVLLWNYRGYGRTKGWSSPGNLTSDGLKVAEYALKVKNVTKLVVHGESMGGMVACHIAAHLPITVLFADRTFSSIENIAASYSERARSVLRSLTQWRTDVVADYVNAKCFKFLSCDVHDNIIPEVASLKNGVAYRLVRDM